MDHCSDFCVSPKCSQILQSKGEAKHDDRAPSLNEAASKGAKTPPVVSTVRSLMKMVAFPLIL